MLVAIFGRLLNHVHGLQTRFQRLHSALIAIIFLALGTFVFSFEQEACTRVEALAEFATVNVSAPNPLQGTLHIASIDYSVDPPKCMQRLDAVDSWYLTIVTISTVGYGDLSPQTVPMRTFAMFYILIGCSYVFVLLSNICASFLESYRQCVLSFIDKFDSTAKTVGVDTSGDGLVDAEMSVAGRSKGLSGRGVDLSGDGQVDFIEPPSPLAFWAQELLPAILLWLAMQLGSAAIFMVAQPELQGQFFTAFYHCVITATTVGYGDVNISAPWARRWAYVHILVSVSWLAALVGQVNASMARRKLDLQRAALLTKQMSREEVLRLDVNGDGIDKLEFVVGMLQNLGVELCGEPLRWDDVLPFMKTFDKLDVSKSGKIDSDDLDKYYVQEQERAQVLHRKLNWKRHASYYGGTALQMMRIKPGKSKIDPQSSPKSAKPPSPTRDAAAPIDQSKLREYIEADAAFRRVSGGTGVASVAALSEHLVDRCEMSLDKVQGIFKELDTNGDGIVDLQEWRVGYTKGLV